MNTIATQIVRQNREVLIEVLNRRIKNYKDLLEEAFLTEDEALIEGIQNRIREDREQRDQLRS